VDTGLTPVFASAAFSVVAIARSSMNVVLASEKMRGPRSGQAPGGASPFAYGMKLAFACQGSTTCMLARFKYLHMLLAACIKLSDA